MILSNIICKQAPVTKPKRLNTLFISPTLVVVFLAFPGLSYKKSCRSFTLAAVQMKPTGLLEAIKILLV